MEPFLLHLADNALILGHRNSEWTGHGPILEQDIAISNIALDLIGQARNFYQYAAKKINEYPDRVVNSKTVTEDSLAFLRDAWDFKNCLLVEQTNGDWAKTILRQFFFSLYQSFLFEGLQLSADKQVAAISEKAAKEVAYHLKWSSEWVIRLGDGTEESHNRMINAIDELSKFTEELFIPASYELEAAKHGVGIDLTLIQPRWKEKMEAVFEEATLPTQKLKEKLWQGLFGKEGRHTEQLGYILAEMQFMQRAYPDSEW
ncbi:MAG: phenylacetate-CoA oxygenase subunit PaaI [Bacteroidetes bacterium]|nr:MAG: phenylacetate-CoA oxygenase subunit PaaI [Bacteroidota bacterium]